MEALRTLDLDRPTARYSESYATARTYDGLIDLRTLVFRSSSWIVIET